MADLDGLDRRRVGELLLDVVRPRVRVLGEEVIVDADVGELADQLLAELERYGFEVRRG